MIKNILIGEWQDKTPVPQRSIWYVWCILEWKEKLGSKHLRVEQLFNREIGKVQSQWLIRVESKDGFEMHLGDKMNTQCRFSLPANTLKVGKQNEMKWEKRFIELPLQNRSL